MSEKIKLDVKDTHMKTLHSAVLYARLFIKEYPERKGLRDGVVYDSRFYIYRTKTMVVVRDNGPAGRGE